MATLSRKGKAPTRIAPTKIALVLFLSCLLLVGLNSMLNDQSRPVFLWLNTLLNTGSHMPSSRMCRHVYGKGWNISLTLTNRNFFAWLKLYDIDPGHTRSGSPLYYASLCGFHDLAECLISKYPQLVNVCGGYFGTPLLAASAE
jgi:hypothetical protein